MNGSYGYAETAQPEGIVADVRTALKIVDVTKGAPKKKSV